MEKVSPQDHPYIYTLRPYLPSIFVKAPHPSQCVYVDFGCPYIKISENKNKKKPRHPTSQPASHWANHPYQLGSVFGVFGFWSFELWRLGFHSSDMLFIILSLVVCTVGSCFGFVCLLCCSAYRNIYVIWYMVYASAAFCIMRSYRSPSQNQVALGIWKVC